MELIEEIRNKAKKKNKKIVLPEADDERVIKAAGILVDEKIATPILIGNQDAIQNQAADLQVDLDEIEIITP